MLILSACIGIGWWSDVLADAMQHSGKLEIVGCYTRSEDKRKAFAAKYRIVSAHQGRRVEVAEILDSDRNS